jgi:hypothetical protein
MKSNIIFNIGEHLYTIGVTLINNVTSMVTTVKLHIYTELQEMVVMHLSSYIDMSKFTVTNVKTLWSDDF